MSRMTKRSKRNIALLLAGMMLFMTADISGLQVNAAEIEQEQISENAVLADGVIQQSTLLTANEEAGTALAAESGTEQSEENSQTVTYDKEYNIADGSVTIDKDGTYRIYSEDANTSATNTITVGKDISATITLENVNIDVSDRNYNAAFKIEDNSTGDVTVNLVGKNSLTSGVECAGLQKNGSGEKVGTLMIKENGELTAIGGFAGSGIGGGRNGTGSNIEISGGTVTATGGISAAGIGGGADGTGSNIEISDGTVTATGGDYAAGIGGGGNGTGSNSTGSNIKISGGTVTATGGDYAAGIGGGDGGAGSNIRITGGSVKAIPGSDFYGETPHAIGGGIGGDAVIPTNKDGKPVYLLEIENPNAAAIQVNGNAYTPISHGEEKKIYAYLPAGTKDTQNVVTVGDTTKAYWYDTAAENAKWNTLDAVAVPKADETIYTYNGENQTYRIAESAQYTVTGNVQKDADRYTVTVSLNDKENTVWSDGTTADKLYTFTIGQGTLDTTAIEKTKEFPCDSTTSKVGEVALPVDWRWSDTDKDTVLTAGCTVAAEAVYSGKNKGNYTEASRKVIISITKKAHTFDKTEQSATCIKEGHGAYWTCSVCQKMFADEKGVQEISSIPVAAALGHDYQASVTKEPTTTAEGIRTYTCTRCGNTYTESIAKLTSPSPQPTATPSGKPEMPSSQPSRTPEATDTPAPTPTAEPKGTKLKDATGAAYKVTSAAGKTPAVQYLAPKNGAKGTVTVPAAVTIDGVTYKVTSIADNAFKGNKKIKKIVIGSNITSIGKNAFNGCKKLKSITIKTKKLTTKTVKKGAFNGISKKVMIKVPKSRYKTYKKLLPAKGLKKAVKIRK